MKLPDPTICDMNCFFKPGHKGPHQTWTKESKKMSALDNATGARNSARSLEEDIRTEDITLNEARIIMGIIRETEGWLNSARIRLNPSEVL